jgi:hypothetical protein
MLTIDSRVGDLFLVPRREEFRPACAPQRAQEACADDESWENVHTRDGTMQRARGRKKNKNKKVGCGCTREMAMQACGGTAQCGSRTM